MIKKLVFVLLMTTVCMSTLAVAQTDQLEKPRSPQSSGMSEGKFYRLDYLLREMDGTKELSKRNYAITVRSGHDYKQLRTGSRVPVVTGGSNPVSGQQQYQYMDVGMNIDTQTLEDANGVWLQITADLTSIAANETPQNTPSLPPLVRQAKVSASVPVTPGKSTQVFSVDEPTSSRRFELSVTATQVR
jgi:hypothetical protein